MQTWIQIVRGLSRLPHDRPFIGFWRNNVCLMQYCQEYERYFCSAFPVNHMTMIEMHPRDVHDISHWMELPNAPASTPKSKDAGGTNFSKYEAQAFVVEKIVDQKKGRKVSSRKYKGL